jgi:hypothetical protein
MKLTRLRHSGAERVEGSTYKLCTFVSRRFASFELEKESL